MVARAKEMPASRVMSEEVLSRVTRCSNIRLQQSFITRLCKCAKKKMTVLYIPGWVNCLVCEPDLQSDLKSKNNAYLHHLNITFRLVGNHLSDLGALAQGHRERVVDTAPGELQCLSSDQPRPVP